MHRKFKLIIDFSIIYIYDFKTFIKWLCLEQTECIQDENPFKCKESKPIETQREPSAGQQHEPHCAQKPS